MCRFVSFYFEGEGAEIAIEVVRALVWSAKYDSILEKLSRTGSYRHCDGGGFVFTGIDDGLSSILHQRFDFMDCNKNLRALESMGNLLVDLINNFSSGYVIFHARKTVSEPSGSLNAHPYVRSTRVNGNRYVLFFAHNGSVDKERVMKYFMIEYNPSVITDSYAALIGISELLSSGKTPESSIAEIAREYTKEKSAFNTATLIVPSNPEANISLYISYYKSEKAKDDTERDNYYRAYLLRGKGFVGFVPITVLEKLNKCSRILVDKSKQISIEEIDGKVVTVKGTTVKFTSI